MRKKKDVGQRKRTVPKVVKSGQVHSVNKSPVQLAERVDRVIEIKLNRKKKLKK